MENCAVKYPVLSGNIFLGVSETNVRKGSRVEWEWMDVEVGRLKREGREEKGREGKGRERKGKEGKGRERKRKEK